MMNLEQSIDMGILSPTDLERSIYDIRKTFNIPSIVPDEMIFVVIANDILDRYFSPEYVSEEAIGELMGEYN